MDKALNILAEFVGRYLKGWHRLVLLHVRREIDDDI